MALLEGAVSGYIFNKFDGKLASDLMQICSKKLCN